MNGAHSVHSALKFFLELLPLNSACMARVLRLRFNLLRFEHLLLVEYLVIARFFSFTRFSRFQKPLMLLLFYVVHCCIYFDTLKCIYTAIAKHGYETYTPFVSKSFQLVVAVVCFRRRKKFTFSFG